MATTTPTITNKNSNSLSIFMLPWLAHGHISPFLELAKILNQKNILIYFCSTPIILTSIKDQISDFNSTNNNTNKIQLVELHLPSLPTLPPHLHTAKGLPPHLYSTLREAADMVRPNLLKIIRDLNPNLAILDIDLPFNAYLSSSLPNNIPSALFSTSGTTYNSFYLHMLSFHRIDNYPFSAIYMSEYQIRELLKVRETMPEEKRELREHETSDSAVVPKRISFILVKSLREIEGKYIDYLSVVTKKKIVPVGALIRDTSKDDESSEIIEWLDGRDRWSTVFVTFGSEIVLSQDEITEIAHGLELSGVNFIWFLRFPKGEEDRTVDEVLPEGFLEKVKGRGRVLKGWAPQARILGHSSVGGFMSHCGWSSLMESINYGIPIIALPMLYDQPFNAKLMVEIGVGLEIVRDNDGKFEKEQVGKVIKEVVGGKTEEGLRKKARELMEEMKSNGQSTLDGAVEEVVQFMENYKKIQV